MGLEAKTKFKSRTCTTDEVVCRNGCISIGFKSRERSCPYTFLAPGSSVRATGGCKFLWGKVAGRSASEPTGSLVTEMEMPTLSL